MSNLVFPQLDLYDSAYQKLRVRLDVYDEVVFAQRFGPDGQSEAGYLVDPLELAAAFAGIDLNTPVLPRRTLFWSRSRGEERIGVYAPPGGRILDIGDWGEDIGDWGLDIGDSGVKVPLPGMVFVGQGKDYFLFAVKVQGRDGWPNPDEGLFRVPLPNVYYSAGRHREGKICWGTATPPAASARTIWAAFELFFETEFNRDLVGGRSKAEQGDVRVTLRALAKRRARKYPLGDLVEAGMNLQELISG